MVTDIILEIKELMYLSSNL